MALDMKTFFVPEFPSGDKVDAGFTVCWKADMILLRSFCVLKAGDTNGMRRLLKPCNS